MTKAGGKLLNSVTLFDEYQGESVPEGQRSLAFRLIYRALDRTLTDKMSTLCIKKCEPLSKSSSR